MNFQNESSIASILQLDAPVSLANPWRRDRRFFAGLAVTAAALAFVGFAPTYFLKGWFGTPALPTVVHVHGLLMTSWFVLLIVQTSLVAARRTDLHRRFGVVGAVLAVVIVVMTVVMVIIGLRVPRGVFAMDATVALVSLGSVAQFAAFVGAALVCRRKPDAHKRLMFIATAVLITASVGRWPIIRVLGGSSAIVALAVYAVSDLLVVAMTIHDLVTRRRVHASLVWGGFALVVAQYLQEAARYTNAGRAIVGWLQA